MIKITEYTYLGTNGTLTTPIHLEGIYSVKKCKMIADKDFILTNGAKQRKIVIVPLEEIDDWIEIPYEEKGQEELFELQ